MPLSNVTQLKRAPAKRRSARAQEPRPATLPPFVNTTSRQSYTDQELSPYTGRPGSLDFLACPSRTGTSLHYRSPDCIQFQRSELLA